MVQSDILSLNKKEITLKELQKLINMVGHQKVRKNNMEAKKLSQLYSEEKIKNFIKSEFEKYPKPEKINYEFIANYIMTHLPEVDEYKVDYDKITNQIKEEIKKLNLDEVVAGLGRHNNPASRMRLSDLANDVGYLTSLNKRIGTTTSSATPTINTDNVDMYIITAQAEDITSFTTNLSGTPTNGQTLWIAITGTASRALTFGDSFEASTVALPTTTDGTNRLDVGFIWNSATNKWRIVATA